jgi:hypothetical protein
MNLIANALPELVRFWVFGRKKISVLGRCMGRYGSEAGLLVSERVSMNAVAVRRDRGN